MMTAQWAALADPTIEASTVDFMIVDVCEASIWNTVRKIES
jgi:hypothetical protein